VINMRRKAINNLLIIVLSAVIFITGAGVTITDYCCSDCRMELFFMSGKDCCSIHNHSTQEYKSICCDLHKDLEDTSCNEMVKGLSTHHCSTSRISVDIDSSVSRPLLTTPFFWISDNPLIHRCTIACVEACPSICEHMEIPITATPRTYLSFIRVLII